MAQSCGELAQFVKAETRTSLILSIIQQLIEDPDAVVREAASHNLAILLPCFPSMDKYFKVSTGQIGAEYMKFARVKAQSKHSMAWGGGKCVKI